MRLISSIKDALREPRLDGVKPWTAEFLELHHKILSEKKMMKEVFEEFYELCMQLDIRFFRGEGKRIEIGAGTSFFKSLYPEVIMTDVQAASHLEMVVDAQNMPFEDSSVRAIYGINCFHHIPDPSLFFKELVRVLSPEGGGCVLIEPHNGFIARRFYKDLFSEECFDEGQAEWQAGIERNAKPNQAISHVVFGRDRRIFDRLFPDLEILLDRPLSNYMRYLFSGGLNFKQLLPDVTTPLVKILELALSPVNQHLALHHVVVLRKNGRNH